MKFKATEMHAIAEVQTTIHWQVTFTGGPFTDGEALQKRMTSSDIPTGEHTPIDVVTHGYKFPGPGVVNRSGEWSGTFFESVTADIVDMMQRSLSDIMEATSDDVTAVQLKGHQELFGTIKLELMDKQDTVKQTYTLNKCILKSIDPGGELADGADSADYYKPKVTIAYGWYNHEKN